MWFSLFAIVLILTITFFQGLQGLFSSLINCVLVILAAALAFGYYENLYYAFLVDYQPDNGRAIALVAIFIVSVLLFRLIFDLAITESVSFPMLVERIGGGAFGLVTALVMTGILAIGFQMLDFPSRFLGFERYEPVRIAGQASEDAKINRGTLDWQNIELRRNGVWLSPDGFAAGLVSHLSDNALAGDNNFGTVYPDFLARVHWAKTGYFSNTPNVIDTQVIKRIVGYWDLPPGDFYHREWEQADKQKEYILNKADAPPAGFKRIVARVEFNRSKMDKVDYQATTGQVRLVGRENSDADAEEYYPVGKQVVEDPRKYHDLEFGEGFLVLAGEGDQTLTDLVFEVPDSEGFEPLFLEYKLNARVTLASNKKLEAALQPIGAEDVQEISLDQRKGDSGRGERGRRGDRISGITFSQKKSRFSDGLPFRLTKYIASDLEFAGRGRVSAVRHLKASLDRNWQPLSGNDRPISSIDVPRGQSLLQLSVNKLHPGSWLGKIYGGIIDTIGDFYIVDSQGRNHKPVGAWAMAKVGGQPTFEMVLLGETARVADRGLPKFERINPDSHLRGEYAWYFLFYLPSGTEPVELHTGRTPVDLRSLNLKAPR